jgi:alginate O-acetyltransferase complex protein AlgI
MPAANATISLRNTERASPASREDRALYPILNCLTVLGAPLLAFLAFHERQPAWLVMWSMAFTMYAACKLVVWSHTDRRRTSWWRRAAFLLAWPGMDGQAFLHQSIQGRTRWPSIARSVACVVTGVTLFFAVARLIPGSPTAQAWIGMIGLVMMLHFGVLNLIAFAWQSRGVDAKPIMDSPLAARGVAEFWGRRWNTAFRDLSTPLLFRPLARRYGVATATWGTFLFSGLVHDLVISVPAGGGYGLPTMYFLIQVLAIHVERSSAFRALKLDRPLPKRVFAWMVVLAPAGLLFHEPFRANVILPFMKACGAL